ncbi:transglycosylase SLT domain-containing protein [Vandammella animalimorsus]|nr:transglycosylase SLT domain-containing protein [Vandammella animalimorsus]
MSAPIRPPSHRTEGPGQHSNASPPELSEFANVLERAAVRFSLPALRDEAAVQGMARHFARSDLLGRTQARAGLYLHHFVVKAEQRGLPGELALLPYIESAYNPQATSHAGAVGICQFIRSTGRRFDLPQSSLVDMRRDALRCADAMYSYLEENHRLFGDWHLALAAYNAGEGAVARALQRNRRAGLPTDFGSLRLPRETRNYVPALLGLAALIAQPQRYGYTLPRLPNATQWEAVALPADIDVSRVLAKSGVSETVFRALNPGLRHAPLVPRAVHPHVVLPRQAANRFQQALQAADPRTLSSWQALRVRQRSTVSALASRHGISEQKLRQANGIGPDRLVQPGSVLLVPKTRHGTGDISYDVASTARITTAPRRAATPRAAGRVKPARPISPALKAGKQTPRSR